MLLLMEKLLTISLRLEKSSRRLVRLMGTLLGILPVWYSRRMEKRLFQDEWDPVKRYRKRGNKPGKKKKG